MSKQNKFLVVFLSAMCWFSTCSIAQTTWTGAAGVSWADNGNWDAGVPDAADDVIIPNTANKPLITTAALAKSVAVQSGAVLTINANASLTIDGSAMLALLNQGTVTNNGTIALGALTSTGDYGLVNEGTFNNNAAGKLGIDRTANIALWHKAGVFINAGQVNIGQISTVGPGLYNEGDFQNTGGQLRIDNTTQTGIFNRSVGTLSNTGKIVIGHTGSIGGPGIYNFSVFENKTGGELRIDRADTGIFNSTGSSCTNKGKMIIGAVAELRGPGLYITTAFNNDGGEISIDRSGTGIHNAIYTLFDNSGKINIGTIRNLHDGPGIYNLANFTNKVGGEINLDSVSTDAGVHHGAGTFINKGKITMGITADIYGPGLYNEAIFTNDAGAEINIDRITTVYSNALFNSYAAVFNNSGKIVIGKTQSAGAHGLINYSTFNNNSGGEIHIDHLNDNSNTNGIFNNPINDKTFTNVGKIFIGSIANGGKNGLYNNGNFNNAGGEISIDHISVGVTNNNNHGLRHQSGTFTNTGKITIGDAVEAGDWGLWCQSAFNNEATGEIYIDRCSTAGLRLDTYTAVTFTNKGKLTIGSKASPGKWGLWNNSIFNNTGGEIRIDRTTVTGLRNQLGAFTNTGKLTIGALASAGDWGLWNETAFDNTGGEIRIDNTTINGLRNQVNTFTNTGKLTIGSVSSVGNWGLWNQSTFLNNSGGEISVDRVTIIAVNNAAPGVFTNAAKITIGANVTQISIANLSSFSNDVCAIISSASGAVYNESTFSNGGLMTIGTGQYHFNTGTFTNNGILSYLQSNPIPNVINNDLTIVPVNGICNSVPTTLQIGGMNSFTVGTSWYKDAALTLVAGTYNQAGNVFMPANLPGGINTLYFTVLDNSNGCSRTVSMQMNVILCQINGYIIWKQDNTTGVKDVTVTLAGDQNGSVVTSANGNYVFVTNGTGNNYTVTPAKNLNKLNGVNVQDLARIQQHLNGNPITDPYQLVAADVNSNNVISSLDANIIQLALLGNPSALTQFVNSWRFVPTSYPLPNPPWGFPEKMTLTGSTGGVNFYGIKVGDVAAANANPANVAPPPPFVLTTADKLLQTGEELTADFQAGQIDDLAAFQFGLHFDPQQLQLIEIQSLPALPLTDDNFGLYELAEGNINILWAGTENADLPEAAPVLRLKFKVLSGGSRLSESLTLNEDVLSAAAYNSDLAASKVVLDYLTVTGTNNPGAADSHLQLLQNQPNPFNGRTQIGFEVPESCTAQLRIFDAAGRVIALRSNQYAAGKHNEVFELTNVSGILYYELSTPFGVLSKKMVVVKN